MIPHQKRQDYCRETATLFLHSQNRAIYTCCLLSHQGYNLSVHLHNSYADCLHDHAISSMLMKMHDDNPLPSGLHLPDRILRIWSLMGSFIQVCIDLKFIKPLPSYGKIRQTTMIYFFFLTFFTENKKYILNKII